MQLKHDIKKGQDKKRKLQRAAEITMISRLRLKRSDIKQRGKKDLNKGISVITKSACKFRG